MKMQWSGRDLRRIVLEQSNRANVGHIGSCLSIVDVLTALYGEVLRIESPEDPDRDRFVLSKGHAALALYGALALKGWLTIADLDSFCADGSQIGYHPEHCVRGVDFSTGSLGQGLSYGAGAALAARIARSSRRTFVLISDAECNEGAVWETAMFAAHRQLSNLVALIDLNGQQALGYTREVLSLDPMGSRWEAFGWHVEEVDGHDSKAIAETLNNLNTRAGPPHMIICHTTFGKGVSFMENRIEWHYLPMSQEQYVRALTEVDGE